MGLKPSSYSWGQLALRGSGFWLVTHPTAKQGQYCSMWEGILVCWLLNVPATGECISWMDLLRQFTCCHTEIEVADQTFHLTQSKYTDTGLASPSADPILPGTWQSSHWSANFQVTGMTRPWKNPNESENQTRDLPLSRQTP